jgi:hypothetical protein
LQVFQDVQRDLQDNSKETKELIISSFVDKTFDFGIAIAKLCLQLTLIANHLSRIKDVINKPNTIV